MTSVKIIKDSIRYGSKDRITTFLVRFPRFIEPELLRHRMFSFSAASSRAISLEKHISNVINESYCPAPFTKDCKGMSAKENITERNSAFASKVWANAKSKMVDFALGLKSLEVHKQHASRLLQPFEYTEYLITATDFQNFWNLRCPNYTSDGIRYFSKKYSLKGATNTSTAQPEIQELAELMYNAYIEHEPTVLGKGVWHIPFSDNIPSSYSILACLKIASARMARISYLNHDGTTDLEADLKLADRLISAGHWSVFEHCARTMDAREYVDFIHGNVSSNFKSGVCNNFTGFIQFRYALENGYQFND